MVKSPDLDLYSRIIIENKLISHLSQIKKYTVIERRDLPAIITEREFQEFYNNEYSAKSFESAEQILICNVYSIDDQFSINLKMEAVKTGVILASTDFFTDNQITSIVNTLPSGILNLIKQQFSDFSLSEDINFISAPIRNTKLFSKKLISLKTSFFNGLVKDLVINGNELLVIGNPLKIFEYQNFLDANISSRLVFEYPHWEVTYSIISEYNQLFACTLIDGMICIWDYNDWGPPYQFENPDKKAACLSFSADHSMLFSGFSDGSIDFMDLNMFENIFTEKISNYNIVFIESIEGGLLIVDRYQNIYLYNIIEKEIVAIYNSYDQNFSEIKISNDKKILAISQLNGKLILFDISSIISSEFINDNWVNPFIRYKSTFMLSSNIKSFDFSPSDDIIAVLLGDGEIGYIDIINKSIYEASEKMDSLNYNLIKFVDDYNFILSTINGELKFKNIK